MADSEYRSEYQVVIQPEAERDAENYAKFILTHHQDDVAALKWLNGFLESTNGLSQTPKRFRIIDEQDKFAIELRQYLYHSHRVIYHIDEESLTVHILRLYHSSRDELQPPEVTF